MQFYNNIDEIEAYRFFYANEKPGILVKGSDMYNPPKIEEDISSVLEELNDQLIDRFGISKKHKRKLDLRKTILKRNQKILKLQLDKLKGKNTEAYINLETTNLQKKIDELIILSKEDDKINFLEEIITLERVLDIDINFEKVKLSKFFTLNNLANEQSNRHKQANKRK